MRVRKFLAGLLRCSTHKYVLVDKKTTDYGYRKENRFYYECESCGDQTYHTYSMDKEL